MADYLPRAGGQLDSWSRSFSSVITKAPGDYGLSSAEAEEIRQAVAAHAAAFVLTRSPGSRIGPNFAVLDVTRKAMLKVLRRYVRTIKANSTISDQLKR